MFDEKLKKYSNIVDVLGWLYYPSHVQFLQCSPPSIFTDIFWFVIVSIFFCKFGYLDQFYILHSQFFITFLITMFIGHTCNYLSFVFL